MTELTDFVSLCKNIGHSVDNVQGGGGNISVKISPTEMVIKASGTTLKRVDLNNGHTKVRFDLINEKLNKIQSDTITTDNDNFNRWVSSTEINLSPQSVRPSIETGFHAILGKCVIHSHSVLSNLVNCCTATESVLKDIFSNSHLNPQLIDFDLPGLELTLKIDSAHKKNNNKSNVFFLKNHGLIVCADSESEALELHQSINSMIRDYFSLQPLKITEQIDAKTFIVKDSFLNNFLSDFNFKINDVFEKILFPDQVVYLSKDKLLFDENNFKIIANSQTEALYIYETLYVYVYIHRTLRELKLEPCFLQSSFNKKINSLESEKFRKQVVK